MSAADVQALLRFLTKDAKVTLATAMGKIKALQDAQLATVEAIAKAKLGEITVVFPDDDKMAKSVHSAAKRLSKKRAAGESDTALSKRARKDPFEVPGSRPAGEAEASLDITPSTHTLAELEDMVFQTNRAPLVLAFAATCVKHTMPEQPPSSRLSLAQAVVSLGSQSKAKAIGLSNAPTAEDEGWAQGQPVVRVMNREISVLKRWGYEWNRDQGEEAPESHNEEKPALWAIDLEQLKHLNGPLTFSGGASTDTGGLPVYSPQAARGYLYRSFDTFAADDKSQAKDATSPKKKQATSALDREKNVGALMQALDLLFESWSSNLTSEELDKRSWSWYVSVRPDVEHGVAGWGAKGPLKLKDILDLRRGAS